MCIALALYIDYAFDVGEAWQLSGISAICEMRLKLGAGGAAGGGLAEGFDAVGRGDAGDEARGVGGDDGDRAVEVQ